MLQAFVLAMVSEPATRSADGRGLINDPPLEAVYVSRHVGPVPRSEFGSPSVGHPCICPRVTPMPTVVDEEKHEPGCVFWIASPLADDRTLKWIEEFRARISARRRDIALR
jgi:hypothetical protein